MDFWELLRKYPNLFDGDYRFWDGAMRREFQEVLNEELSACQYEEYRMLALVLLMYLCETLRVGKGMAYITNHSVPSGHGLTALYNSLINKMYVAYAWYLLVGQHLKMSEEDLLDLFERQVYDPVYGDDIAVGVAEGIKHRFNAITYSAVMRDLGIGFTAATKKDHDKPFSSLRDITFLKRSFMWHPVLNTVVGPLDLKVLRNTAAYVHDVSRDEEITRQKMDSIQRELFLHPTHIYTTYWRELKECFYHAFNTRYEGLTEVEMISKYHKGILRDDLFEVSPWLDAESSREPPIRGQTYHKLIWPSLLANHTTKVSAL